MVEAVQGLCEQREHKKDYARGDGAEGSRLTIEHGLGLGEDATVF